MKDMFNDDAEVAFLSLLLKNPENSFNVNKVKPFMLSSVPNRILFETISDIVETSLSPEHHLVINILKSKNLIGSCGGEEYIKYLVNQDYNQDSLKEYERLILDSYKSRSLLSLSSKIPELVNGNDVDYAISNIRNTLDNLTSTSGGESVCSIKDACQEMWEGLLKTVENPNVINVTTGFKNIDMTTGGFSEGDLWVIGGRPSMGKSTWLCNSALNSAKKGRASLIFSLEMSLKVIIRRLVSMETGIPTYSIKFGQVNQKQMDLISDTLKNIKDLPIYIDTNYSANINYIVSTIRKYRKMHDIDIAYLDYIQLLAERNMDSTHELGRITRELKLVSNELKISTVILSQLNREVESRNPPRPKLSDLRQSGNIEEDADVVILLYRDDLYKKDSRFKGVLENIIAKQREGDVGSLFMNFNLEINKLEEK